MDRNHCPTDIHQKVVEFIDSGRSFAVAIVLNAGVRAIIDSKRKVALIRENFIESGLATTEEFDRVHASIGLDIGAVTVPEIAASITAQLIAVRRKSNPHLPPSEKELQ